MLRSLTPTPGGWPSCLAQLVVAACLGLAAPARAQVLYDASLGTMPEPQGWTYGELGSEVSRSLSGNSVLLDTSTRVGAQAGWSRLAEPTLDREAGFTLLFTAKLNAEAHTNHHRAGFSVILLGADANGVELAFWTNTVFVQDGPPNLFTHAEDTALPARDGYVDYALTIGGADYVLHADGVPILSGPVRDYTSFGGLINPYKIPNFIFVGDNTKSASASVNVKRVVLIHPPTLRSPAPGVVSWLGIHNLSYRLQVSSNLVDWVDRAVVTSITDTFSFSNAPTQAQAYFRVAHP